MVKLGLNEVSAENPQIFYKFFCAAIELDKVILISRIQSGSLSQIRYTEDSLLLVCPDAWCSQKMVLHTL